MLVCATGRQTALGMLADTLIAKPPPTAFEIGLRRFSELILRIIALMVLFVLTESLWFHRGWLESLMFALALAVGLTPELLQADTMTAGLCFQRRRPRIAGAADFQTVCGARSM